MKKILVVDDEAINRFVIEMILRDFNCALFFAVDGVDGYKKFKEFSPDVVLIEFRMPCMDGFRLVKMIKHERPDTVIIMMTGDKCVKHQDESIPVLDKPINIVELVRLIGLEV